MVQTQKASHLAKPESKQELRRSTDHIESDFLLDFDVRHSYSLSWPVTLSVLTTRRSHGKMIIDIHTVTMSQARSHTTQLSPLLVPSQPRYISDVSSHAVDTNNIQDAPKGGVITKFQGHDQSNLQSIIGEAIRQPFPGGKTTEEFQIQLIATLRRGCARDCQCQCQCHSPPPRTRPHPAISPIRRWLDSAYNIIPRFGTQRCNVYTCQRGYSPVHVNFRIPLWFCSRTLEASLSFSSVVGVGASLHLHVARMFSNYNISWEIHENKIEWVRLRLFRREISPIDHDAYSKPGYLIHVSTIPNGGERNGRNTNNTP